MTWWLDLAGLVITWLDVRQGNVLLHRAAAAAASVLPESRNA